MATAVETGSEPRKPPAAPLALPLASLLGTLYVLAALAILLFVLPQVWNRYVFPLLGDRLVEWILWLPVVSAASAGLLWLGHILSRFRMPRGLRGGVLLMFTGLFLLFQIWRWLSLYLSDTPGLVVSLAIGLALIYMAVRFYTGPTAARWAVALEEQGWFSVASYKSTLGKRLRRLTILGIALIGLTGIYSLEEQSLLPEHWTVELPFDWGTLTLIPHARTTLPILLGLLTLWVAWRTVHVPTFAEFLIATEAEMNKVNWPTRRQLAQDTIVVLMTTLLLAIFLLAVDLFWGWLLSRERVGVLPPAPSGAETKAGVQERIRW
ncbi:MAG: preprotein translocase subunit SecE [Gemmataceae bacterium]|nr:preprotein translocase subunit SecE [Gemmataceae bacterium]MCS7271514.1 preprotein translocase subunit SecE [Gemmataceae bacterium]MDW8241929.1 preprotein translocase subunit SecE [Thermogemmata sp.]